MSVLFGKRQKKSKFQNFHFFLEISFLLKISNAKNLHAIAWPPPLIIWKIIDLENVFNSTFKILLRAASENECSSSKTMKSKEKSFHRLLRLQHILSLTIIVINFIESFTIRAQIGNFYFQFSAQKFYKNRTLYWNTWQNFSTPRWINKWISSLYAMNFKALSNFKQWSRNKEYLFRTSKRRNSYSSKI